MPSLRYIPGSRLPSYTLSTFLFIPRRFFNGRIGTQSSSHLRLPGPSFVPFLEMSDSLSHPPGPSNSPFLGFLPQSTVPRLFFLTVFCRLPTVLFVVARIPPLALFSSSLWVLRNCPIWRPASALSRRGCISRLQRLELSSSFSRLPLRYWFVRAFFRSKLVFDGYAPLTLPLDIPVF